MLIINYNFDDMFKESLNLYVFRVLILENRPFGNFGRITIWFIVFCSIFLYSLDDYLKKIIIVKDNIQQNATKIELALSDW